MKVSTFGRGILRTLGISAMVLELITIIHNIYIGFPIPVIIVELLMVIMLYRSLPIREPENPSSRDCWPYNGPWKTLPDMPVTIMTINNTDMTVAPGLNYTTESYYLWVAGNCRKVEIFPDALQILLTHHLAQEHMNETILHLLISGDKIKNKLAITLYNKNLNQ